MINTETETLIDFAAAAKRLPRTSTGKSVHAKTVARWALCGIRGVKLESLCIGSRRFTSVEACTRFFARLTDQANGRPARRTSENTRRQLVERGLM